MGILEDGLISANDFPDETPELRLPSKPVPHWAQKVPDALSREEYLRIGRPLLIAAGFLKPDGSEATEDKPPLPKMPSTPRKAKKPPTAKPVKEPEVPF